MIDTTKRSLLIALGIVAAAALTGAIVWTVRQAESGTGTHAGLVTDEQLAQALNSKEVIASGAVQDSAGRVVEGTTVTLSLYNSNGQPIWRLVRPVQPDGSFKIELQDLPSLPNIYAGTLVAEAPNYLAAKADVSVEIGSVSSAGQDRLTGPSGAQAAPTTLPVMPANQTRPTQISPRRIHLKLSSCSPWITLIVLAPALFGLFLAIMHLSQFTRGMWVTYWYSLGTASLWALVVSSLTWLYIKGNPLIPLFWPDLFVSSGVVIFAFIGNCIYVAYAISEKRHSFFDADESKRKSLLLRLGGRIFVAPYIALAAYGIFAATFPTLRTGPFAAFFGFFSGLWIKPILEALNDIGLRLLSVEERQKVAAEATRAENSEAPTQPTSSALALRPEQAFLDAVNAAREELLKKDGVISVAPSFRETPTGNQTQDSIVVYVYEKGDVAAVDESYRGFPTEIVALPPAGRDQMCSPIMSKISWSKINQDNLRRLSSLNPTLRPAKATIVNGTQIVLIHDPDERLFNQGATNSFQIFDVMQAHDAIRPLVAEQVDFVSFAIDKDSGLPKVGDYHVPVHSDIQGINYDAPGNPGTFSERERWNDKKLRACFVRSLNLPFSLYRYLHELGHYWCAYVTFSAEGKGGSAELLDRSDDQQGRYHWGLNFDNQLSPMDYDRVHWIARGDNTFERQNLEDDEVEYCPLDLYLMGLLPPEAVGNITILRNIEPAPTTSNNKLVTAQPFTISLQNIIDSCGERIPRFGQSPTSFTQALTVVSKDQASGEQFARKLEDFRTKYEKKFHEATKIGSLSTTLTST